MSFFQKIFFRSQADTGPLGASARIDQMNDKYLGKSGLSYFLGKIKTLLDLNDSGWIIPTLESEFKVYSNSSVKYRKKNGTVEIVGAVAPSKAIEGGVDEHVIFRLPAGYRPTDVDRRAVMQGSGSAKWLLVVQTTGEVTFSRHSNDSGFTTAYTSAWLPFSFSFLQG